VVDLDWLTWTVERVSFRVYIVFCMCDETLCKLHVSSQSEEKVVHEVHNRAGYGWVDANAVECQDDHAEEGVE
jgi:hypothetical protein